MALLSTHAHTHTHIYILYITYARAHTFFPPLSQKNAHTHTKLYIKKLYIKKIIHIKKEERKELKKKRGDYIYKTKDIEKERKKKGLGSS